MKSYSLAEAAEMLRGSRSKAAQDWLARRLRRGELPGFKAPGWRMTEQDIADAVEALRPRVVVPTVPQGGLTRTSRRRLAS